MLDALLLSRIQFAFTAIVHNIFVPLTIGLAILIAYMEFKYWRTKDPLYDTMARFWFRLLLVNFAVGLATGITMEFQFGTNWADHSRYVGDIFGAPLAAEALFAFFLESVFIGLLIFGRDKISKGMRFFSSLMIALGTTMSAFWILAANSWQQTPAGFRINEALNRAEMTNFAEAVLNPSTLTRFTHVMLGALLTGAFFILAISAYYIIKKRNLPLAKKSFKMAAVVGLVVAVLQGISGHSTSQLVGEVQPEKLAAYEAHWETQERAPLLLFAIPDYENETNKFEIGIPGMLSFLSHNDINEPVIGLEEFAAEDRPPIFGNFLSFRGMAGIGMVLILWTIFLVTQFRNDKIFNKEWAMKASLIMLPLPYLANTFGWIVTEWGRQPWTVYGFLRTEDAVSSVSALEVGISLGLFGIVYVFLLFLMTYLMVKEVKKYNMYEQGYSEEEFRREASA